MAPSPCHPGSTVPLDAAVLGMIFCRTTKCPVLSGTTTTMGQPLALASASARAATVFAKTRVMGGPIPASFGKY